ncbi:FAD dependent oxidoreductase [Phlyctema vagabunda]|uniref:FAD dependent oxidoreductase n=1 Tax=Phlyctema vagabunda TaxID=108571 RepID=A0ABR4PD36_9HELO
MEFPASIIIVGSGVFGLSTAYAMTRDPVYANTTITIVDAWDFEVSSTKESSGNPRSANFDTSRIIRSEYPHSAYANLARESQTLWRGEWGADGRYVGQKLLLSARGSSMKGERKKFETINYVKNAFELSRKTAKSQESLQILDSPSEIRRMLGPVSSRALENEVQNDKSDSKILRGYLSGDCGWADGCASIKWLREQVIRSERLNVRTGFVRELVVANQDNLPGSKASVRGVKLSDGDEIYADLVIVAAGSHTPYILGMKELCDVYSEVVAYIKLTTEECNEFRKRKVPIIVNADQCVFAIGPDNDGYLKLGRFSYSGYADVRSCGGVEVGPRVRVNSSVFEQDSDKAFGWGGEIENLEPWNLKESVKNTLSEYRIFLEEFFGTIPGGEPDCLSDIARRPFAKVRQCWYTDTPSTDFIVDYHPAFGKSVFVATGGSDHAFKFLPVIGQKVAAIVLEHRGLMSSSRGPTLDELCRLWKFPDAESKL